MADQMSSCCCGSGSCCPPKQENKKIQIDFLYLDLSVCQRCQGTEKNLQEAVDEVSGVLTAAGFDVTVSKVNILTKELAVKYHFISSPTIRINGKDIEMEVKESNCKDCGDLCGEDVDCRVYSYNGEDYTEPPKAMIINAILKEAYTGQKTSDPDTEKENYTLPDNLERFFAGKQNN